MRHNPKENPNLVIERIYFLVIIFLMAALIFFLFMMLRASKNLTDPWDKGPGINLGSDMGFRRAANPICYQQVKQKALQIKS